MGGVASVLCNYALSKRFGWHYSPMPDYSPIYNEWGSGRESKNGKIKDVIKMSKIPVLTNKVFKDLNSLTKSELANIVIFDRKTGHKKIIIFNVDHMGVLANTREYYSYSTLEGILSHLELLISKGEIIWYYSTFREADRAFYGEIQQ